MICKECGIDCDSIKTLLKHLKKEHNLDEKTYYVKHELKEPKIEPKCIECGKPARFLNLLEGFDPRCPRCRIRFLQREHYKNLSQEEKTKIANKSHMTRLLKYGDPNYNNMEKNKQTKLKNYGDPNYNNREKALKTYPKHSTESIEKQKKVHFEKWLKRFSEKANTIFNASVIDGNDGYHIKLKCNICNHEFSFVKPALNNYLRWNTKNICPFCFPNFKTSRAEREIFTFIESLGETVRANDISVLGRKELDIYLPERKIGIEYDGLFWHCAQRGGFIKNKSDLCEKEGIRCIHIFEDEWLNKPDIVKSRLSGILGHNKRIYARKTIYKEIDKKIAKTFLETNHLQGYCGCEHAVGLYLDDNLVSVMTFGKSRFKNDEYELLRFANILNTNVIGAASKLLKHFLNDHNIDKIVTFADKRWSNGDLYYKIGFEKVCENPPSFYYILSNTQRISRFYSWKHKDASYKTIYDCGTIKFMYTKKS